MRFKLDLGGMADDVEVRFSRWGFSFQLIILESDKSVLLQRWNWWPQRSYWARVNIGQEPTRELYLQIEKLPWWRLPGIRPFTYRVFIDGELVLEKYGY